MLTTLRITKVSDEDNGKYTLLIKNTAGETKADTMLDVMGKPKPPRIIKEIDPPELTLPGKKDLRLQCKKGHPVKYYPANSQKFRQSSWRPDAEIFRIDSSHCDGHSGSFAVADGGSYSCADTCDFDLCP